MAPRRQPWTHEEPPSIVSGNTSSLALVLEDYEVFEAETAELSIEEVDDFSSLLLDVEHSGTNGNAYYGDGVCELITLVTRNFHPVHSAHSLATTSVVAPAQHAHTAEYKLLANTGAKQPSSSYTNGRGAEINANTEMLEHYETSFLPVHLLTAVSQCDRPRSPACWPDQLLAYTDAPAFVNAVNADLAKVCSRLNNPGPVQVTPCDHAPEWTTCRLTCCQAGVEWLAARLPTTTHSSTDTLIGPSTSTHSFEQKRLNRNVEPIPIHIRSRVLELPEVLSTGLCAFSGLRPEVLCISSAFTAVYLLLVADQNNTVSSPPQDTVNWMDDGSQAACFSTAWSTAIHSDSPSVWAMMVSLVPWSKNPTNVAGLSNTRLLLSGCEDVMLRTEQNLVALAVLVDVIREEDENGSPVFRAIIHQRLHHLPDLAVFFDTA